MPRPAWTGWLLLLLGCGGTGNPVLAPAPRQIPENSKVRVWSGAANRIIYRARVHGDTLTGSVLAPAGRGAAKVAIPLADIDSLQVMSGQTAGVFLVGFAVGAIFIWRLLAGGI